MLNNRSINMLDRLKNHVETLFQRISQLPIEKDEGLSKNELCYSFQLIDQFENDHPNATMPNALAPTQLLLRDIARINKITFENIAKADRENKIVKNDYGAEDAMTLLEILIPANPETLEKTHANLLFIDQILQNEQLNSSALRGEVSYGVTMLKALIENQLNQLNAANKQAKIPNPLLKVEDFQQYYLDFSKDFSSLELKKNKTEKIIDKLPQNQIKASPEKKNLDDINNSLTLLHSKYDLFICHLCNNKSEEDIHALSKFLSTLAEHDVTNLKETTIKRLNEINKRNAWTERLKDIGIDVEEFKMPVILNSNDIKHIKKLLKDTNEFHLFCRKIKNASSLEEAAYKIAALGEYLNRNVSGSCIQKMKENFNPTVLDKTELPQKTLAFINSIQAALKDLSPNRNFQDPLNYFKIGLHFFNIYRQTNQTSIESKSSPTSTNFTNSLLSQGSSSFSTVSSEIEFKEHKRPAVPTPLRIIPNRQLKMRAAAFISNERTSSTFSKRIKHWYYEQNRLTKTLVCASLGLLAIALVAAAVTGIGVAIMAGLAAIGIGTGATAGLSAVATAGAIATTSAASFFGTTGTAAILTQAAVSAGAAFSVASLTVIAAIKVDETLDPTTPVNISANQIKSRRKSIEIDLDYPEDFPPPTSKAPEHKNRLMITNSPSDSLSVAYLERRQRASITEDADSKKNTPEITEPQIIQTKTAR